MPVSLMTVHQKDQSSANTNTTPTVASAPEDDATSDWVSIANFFGVALPAHGPIVPLLHTTPEGKKNRFVVATKAVAAMLLDTQLYRSPGVEVVGVGCRTFERLDDRYIPDAPCRYRAAAEGLDWLATVATRRILRFDAVADAALLAALLQDAAMPHDVLLGHPTAMKSPEASCCLGGDGSLVMGSVLVAIDLKGWLRAQGEARDPRASSPTVASSVWWMCGTLNGRRLELTMDHSVRRLAAKALFDRDLPLA